MLPLPSPFCSNDSKTLSALRETFTNASQPTPNGLIRKNSDLQNIHRGKGGGAKEARKMREFGTLPSPSPINSAPHGPSTKNEKNLITRPKTLLVLSEYKKRDREQ